MKPAALVPAGQRDQKPPHGRPCNSCGLCCMATLCPLAQAVFGQPEHRRCPALTQTSASTYGCGLVADPMKWAMRRTLVYGLERMREAALHLIGSGTGCDARFDGEPADADFYRRLIAHDRRTRDKTADAKRLWLGRLR